MYYVRSGAYTRAKSRPAVPPPLAHLGPYEIELHGQHYGEHQEAPHQAGATGIRPVYEVRVACNYEPGDV